jgi:hypothetical protein
MFLDGIFHCIEVNLRGCKVVKALCYKPECRGFDIG